MIFFISIFIMSSNGWSGIDHYNDNSFIETSIKMPLQVFSNNFAPYTLKFRQLGDRNKEEAVIFLPSAYESEASCFRIAPLFEKAGYRFVSVTADNHTDFEMCIQTFDQFYRYLGVTAIHYIGVDFGGFLALQLQNTINFAAKCLSLTLINSYTRNDMFVPRKITMFSVFGSFVAKSNLMSELTDIDPSLPPLNSTEFVKKEVESMKMAEARDRMELRMAMTPPLYLHVPPQAIMSIEPLDRRMEFTPRFLPSLTISVVKQALMKHGGDFPHLECPEDCFTYILCHIKKWTPTTEADIQETPQDTAENQAQE